MKCSVIPLDSKIQEMLILNLIIYNILVIFIEYTFPFAFDIYQLTCGIKCSEISSGNTYSSGPSTISTTPSSNSTGIIWSTITNSFVS